MIRAMVQICLVFATSISCITPASASPAYHFYHVNDLGIQAPNGSYAWGINNNGQVVGEIRLSNGRRHAFLWQFGHVSDLGTFDGSSSAAMDINDSGHIVGWSSDFYTERAILLHNGNISHLTPFLSNPDRDYLANSYYHRAHGINNSGQIVGQSEHYFIYGMNEEGYLDSDYYIHPVLWQKGGVAGAQIRLGQRSAFYDINDYGQIVGHSNYGAILLTKNNDLIQLGTLGHRRYSIALGINNFAINKFGQIVGESFNFALGAPEDKSDRRAFLWQDGTMFDLNDLIDSKSDWTIVSAGGINDAGWIAATAYSKGFGHRAVILTPAVKPITPPIPEPEARTLIIAGLALLGWLVARRRTKHDSRESSTAYF